MGQVGLGMSQIRIFVRQANVQFYILENRVTRGSQVRLFGCPRKDTVTIKMSQEADGKDVKRVLTNTVFILIKNTTVNGIVKK